MTLGDLIAALEKCHPARTVRLGFARPHSYRGYYESLAFEPAWEVTVGSMLDAARSALGATFAGWKGGEYEMNEWTDVYLAVQGYCGEEIGPTLLAYMLTGEPPSPGGSDER